MLAMRRHGAKGLFLGWAFIVTSTLLSSANAASLHQGSLGSSGTAIQSEPGRVLWTYYQTIQLGELCLPNGDIPPGQAPCNTSSNADNIIRLVNPNGAANGLLVGARPQTVCAMIYVFDDDEEMGECCGCPVSSAGLATFSVQNNLTSNWALANAGDGSSSLDPSNGIGAIAIVAAAPNATFPATCADASRGCTGGCDPTNVPGYSVTIANNLLGSITHNQMVAGNPLIQRLVTGMDEISLSDNGAGDPVNLVYLQAQCGALLGNSSGGGICTCPTE